MNAKSIHIEECKKQHQLLTHFIYKILRERSCQLKPWNSDLNTLLGLFRRHVQMEEEVLTPIIREIYSFQEKISDYLHGEHHQFAEKLQQMLFNIDRKNASEEFLFECMDDLLVHIYQEEQLLYPLIEEHLQNPSKENRLNMGLNISPEHF